MEKQPLEVIEFGLFAEEWILISEVLHRYDPSSELPFPFERTQADHQTEKRAREKRKRCFDLGNKIAELLKETEE